MFLSQLFPAVFTRLSSQHWSQHQSYYRSRHHRAQILLLFIASTFVQITAAQTANIEFRAERGYVFENSVDGLLPFVAIINNPTASALSNVQLVISMPSGVNLGNVDSECTESADASIRTLNCTVPSVAAFSSKLLDFFVDGPNLTAVGAGFTVDIASSSSSIQVVEPEAFEASLADGDVRISGSSLAIELVRDITIDIDRNGVSDIDEAIMQLPAGTATEQLLAREAVVDILFLYTPAAASYLDGKLESRIAQIVTATNQTFRENGVAIKFNGVGLASVPHMTTNMTLEALLDSIATDSNPAFDTFDGMVTSSGGDLVVVLHALDPGADTFCGCGIFVGAGRQGDFRAEFHQGELLSVLNVGPDCLGLKDISPLFATNMGIASTRQEHPDGGTFSFSAGYGVIDQFLTLTALTGSNSFGQAESLNLFSNPLELCKSVPCGVDRGDIAQGADAVYSLNKTRHLISALAPSKFPAAPETLPARITVSPSLNYDLEILQTPVDAAALHNELTEVQVNITNVSGVTLEDLDISFVDLNGGLPSNETQVYQNAEPACRILGSDLTIAGLSVSLPVGEAVQKAGTLSCFIESLAPGEKKDFSYRIQIDNTPPVLNGDGFYQEIATVNGIVQLESAMCLPVFANFVLANIGSAVCDNVQVQLPGVAPGIPLDLNALPTVTGSMLSLPFVRLWDGSLLSAEFRITLTGPLALEIVSYAILDPALTPAFAASFDLAGVLRINNLQVDTSLFDVQATHVPDSNPIRFSDLQTVLVSVLPGP